MEKNYMIFAWFIWKKIYNVWCKIIYLLPIIKMKRIRRPLTDINGYDFMTWQKVEAPILKQEENVDKRIEDRMKKKIEESKVNWKIYVEWLGYVEVN